jgi:predicted DNA-binding transcriptional regulator AlpA
MDITKDPREVPLHTNVREDTPLTVRDVAEILRVPPSWVYEHTRERCRDRISGIRLGKYWGFVEADVVAWLATKRADN